MSGTNKEMGHIWVVDGFIERTKSHSNYLIPGIDPIEVDPLLHMVWGWGGNANGYYAYLRDSYQLSKDPEVGTGMSSGYGSLNVFGRYIKR